MRGWGAGGLGQSLQDLVAHLMGCLAALEGAIHFLAALRKAPQNAEEPVAFLSLLLRPHAS